MAKRKSDNEAVEATPIMTGVVPTNEEIRDDFYITHTGRKMLAALGAGETLTIDEIWVGSGNVSTLDTDPRTLNDLLSPEATATRSEPIAVGDEVHFTIQYNNAMDKTGTGFVLGEYGGFMLHPENGRVMIFYGSLGNFPFAVPSYNEAGLAVFSMPVALTLSDGEKLEFGFPAGVLATDERVSMHERKLIADPGGVHGLAVVEGNTLEALVGGQWVRVGGGDTPTLAELGLAFGVDNHASTIVARAVNVPGFVRTTGCRIAVRFNAGISSLNPTLNVNNTGASPILFNGAALPQMTVANSLIPANCVAVFIWTGTAWELTNPARHTTLLEGATARTAAQAATANTVAVRSAGGALSVGAPRSGTAGNNDALRRVDVPIERGTWTPINYAPLINADILQGIYAMVGGVATLWWELRGVLNAQISSVHPIVQILGSPFTPLNHNHVVIGSGRVNGISTVANFFYWNPTWPTGEIRMSSTTGMPLNQIFTIGDTLTINGTISFRTI